MYFPTSSYSDQSNSIEYQSNYEWSLVGRDRGREKEKGYNNYTYSLKADFTNKLIYNTDKLIFCVESDKVVGLFI